MHSVLVMELTLLGMATGSFGLLVLANWVVQRWLGVLAACVLPVAALIYLINDWFSLRAFCNAEPTFVPPSPADEAAGGIGMMIFNCDAPWGILDYLYIEWVGPGLILLTLILASHALLKLSKSGLAGREGVR